MSRCSLDFSDRALSPLDEDILTIGFARRFATYKRAALVFEDLEWLAARTRDDLALALERVDDPQLVLGGHPGKPRGARDDRASSRIARGRQISRVKDTP